MPRKPYAAKVLADEVEELFPDAEMEPYGNPDGLGVYREFRFDKATSIRVGGALRFLDDRRVHSVNLTDAGYLHVVFSPFSSQADSRDPFMLKIAMDVLSDQSAEEAVEESGE